MIFNENASIHDLKKINTVSTDASGDDKGEMFDMIKRYNHLVEVEPDQDDDIQVKNLSEYGGARAPDVIEPHHNAYQLDGNTS